METRYFVKKKTLLALSKLMVLASDLPEDELNKQVDGKSIQAYRTGGNLFLIDGSLCASVLSSLDNSYRIRVLHFYLSFFFIHVEKCDLSSFLTDEKPEEHHVTCKRPTFAERFAVLNSFFLSNQTSWSRSASCCIRRRCLDSCWRRSSRTPTPCLCSALTTSYR